MSSGPAVALDTQLVVDDYAMPDSALVALFAYRNHRSDHKPEEEHDNHQLVDALSPLCFTE